MTQQYLRKVSLKVGDDAGNALDLSQLHIRFEVKNATSQTLKRAQIRVYNLTEDTAQQIQNEFTRVELSAGYEGIFGMIFQGQVAQCARGKENATDSYLDLFAQDGDMAYNWATSNWTLAKGYTPDDVHKRLLQDMSSYGISAGYKPPFTSNASVDALPCYGMTRDQLRVLANAQGCDWGIEDGKLNFVPKAGLLPGQVPYLTPATGLIGTPTQTISGVSIKCLLNPSIRAGGQVQIVNKSLSTVKQRVAYNAGDLVAGLDKGGFYKALQVIHTGDTRGNPFYTNMLCVAVDGTWANNHELILQVPDGA
jgi:hypothetical protein